MYSYRKHYQIRRWVKQAIDNLPVAVGYFNEGGICVLYNKAMYDLVFEMTGKDLQLLEEFLDGIDTCMLSPGFSDEGSYIKVKDKISKVVDKTIPGIHGTNTTQVLCIDVTGLMSLRQDYELSLKKLHVMQKKIEQMSVEVVDIAGQEEVLNAKIQLHDELGRGIIASRLALEKDKPLDDEDLIVWEKAIRFLQTQHKESSKTTSLEDLLQSIKGIGINVQIQGEIPTLTQDLRLFEELLRECSTNSKKHGQAKNIYVDTNCNEDGWQFRLSNDGKLPENPLVFAGGLKSLDEKIERLGGSLNVEVDTMVCVTAKIPFRQGGSQLGG